MSEIDFSDVPRHVFIKDRNYVRFPSREIIGLISRAAVSQVETPARLWRRDIGWDIANNIIPPEIVDRYE